MSTMPPELELTGREDELAYMMRLISFIVDECPRRLATTASERKALEIMETELKRLGLPTEFETFEYNDSLYKNLALHFGLGTLARPIASKAPALGALLHGLVALSYWAESTRRGYLLRRLLRFEPSQNLLSVSPAKSDMRLRVVLLAHIDAAYTGTIFEPWFIKGMLHSPLPDNMRFLDRIMKVATVSQAALAGISLTRLLSGRKLSHLRWAERLLTLPAFAVAAMNLEITLRDEVVPGANDNLTGCAALPVLARRLLADQPDDIEYVFAISGAEEASLGGSDAMAKKKLEEWDPHNTVVLAVDTLSNGEIRFTEREGEVAPRDIDPRIRRALQQATEGDERFRTVRGIDMPVGASDALAFMYRGYPATAISCVDPEIGAPRHYHHPTDTPENIDEAQFIDTVDYIERAVRVLVAPDFW